MIELDPEKGIAPDLYKFLNDLTPRGIYEATFTIAKRFPKLNIGQVYTFHTDRSTYQMEILEIDESDGLTRQYKCRETWGSFRKRVKREKNR